MSFCCLARPASKKTLSSRCNAWLTITNVGTTREKPAFHFIPDHP